jgi:hypothetical protein
LELCARALPFSGLLVWNFMTQHSSSIDPVFMTISFEFGGEMVTESLDIAEHDATSTPVSIAANVELEPYETRAMRVNVADGVNGRKDCRRGTSFQAQHRVSQEN